MGQVSSNMQHGNPLFLGGGGGIECINRPFSYTYRGFEKLSRKNVYMFLESVCIYRSLPITLAYVYLCL